MNLHIQENSLPVGTEKVTLNILASITGDYQSPQGYQRVSPVFWFLCDTDFEKEVTVEIQHCAGPDLTQPVSDLKFAKAVCSQKKLPYTFDLMDDKFSCKGSYGVLSLKSFSGIAAFFRNLIWGRDYFTCLYYPLSQDPNSQQIDLVVTWNTETHLTVSYYDNKLM